VTHTSIGEIVRGDPAVFPPYLYEAYRSTLLRAPKQPLVEVPLTRSELTGPRPAVTIVTPEDADLTRNARTGGEAAGQRIIVTGRVTDEQGRGLPGMLIEIWQANAAGRYVHKADDWPGPLDPHFLGIGRCLTNENGDYHFLTVRPGAYPWRNEPNAWRPAHIHFSVLGGAWKDRLVTQMYFPGDPLHERDAIFNSVPEGARQRLVASYDHTVTKAEWALGWRWNIVLGGSRGTAFESSR
jgi:protocatechuate 3,4-dioxygenase beta subunit